MSLQQLQNTIQSAMNAPSLAVQPIHSGPLAGSLTNTAVGAVNWAHATGRQAYHDYQADQNFDEAMDSFTKGDLVGCFTNACEGLIHMGMETKYDMIANQQANVTGQGVGQVINSTPPWMQNWLNANGGAAQNVTTALNNTNNAISKWIP